jgi:hypothetical protein
MKLLTIHFGILAFSLNQVVLINFGLFLNNIIAILGFLFFLYLVFSYNNFKSRKYEFFTILVLAFIFCFSILQIFFEFFEDYKIFENKIIQLYIYLASLSLYHYFEYIFVMTYHPEKLSFDSM